MAIKTIDMSSCPCCDPCRPYPDYIELSIDYGGSISSDIMRGCTRLFVDCEGVFESCYKRSNTGTIRLIRTPGSVPPTYSYSIEDPNSDTVIRAARYSCFNEPYYCGSDSHSIHLTMRFDTPLSDCLPQDSNGVFQIPEGYCMDPGTVVIPAANLYTNEYTFCLRRLTMGQNQSACACGAVCDPYSVENTFNFCCKEDADTSADLVATAIAGEFSCTAQGSFYITKGAWERAMCRQWDEAYDGPSPVIDNPPCEDIVYAIGGTILSADILAVVKATATPHYPNEA